MGEFHILAAYYVLDGLPRACGRRATILATTNTDQPPDATA